MTDGSGDRLPGRDRAASLVGQFEELAAAAPGLGSALYADLAAAVASDLRSGGPCSMVLGAPDSQVRVGEMRPLAFLAAVHRLVLARSAPALALHYPSVGGTAPRDAASRVACRRAFIETVAENAEVLAIESTTVPQTNEVGRVTGLSGILREVGRRWRLPAALHEIGCSAGLSLRVDELVASGVVVDDRTGSGAMPRIVERIGSDIAPVSTMTTAGRLRLTSFVFPDRLDRLELLRAALAVSDRVSATVRRQSALDHVRSLRLRPGVATVLWHSAMWLYLRPDERAGIEESLEDIGRAATADAPLVRVSLEPTGPNPREFLLEVTTWAGRTERRVSATTGPEGTPVAWRHLAVGAIITGTDGRLLLIRRGRPPAAGLWSVPGGRVEPGETVLEALVREVQEETGLVVEPDREVGIVERGSPDGGTFVIHDWTARVIGGHPRPGDDAVDLAWVDGSDLRDWDRAGRLVPGLLSALDEWGVSPST